MVRPVRGTTLEDAIILLCVRWHLRFSKKKALFVSKFRVHTLFLWTGTLTSRSRPRRAAGAALPVLNIATSLNNIIEQDHRFIQRRIAASPFLVDPISLEDDRW